MSFKDEQGIETLKKLHLALSIGLLMVISVIYYLMVDRENKFTLGGELSEILVLGVVIGALTTIYLIKNKRLDQIQQMSDPGQKWINYRSLQILKFALVEAATLITVVWYFYSANLFLLLIGLGLSLLLFVMKPSREKFFAEALIEEKDQNLF